MDQIQHDIILVGGGAAGLRAAIAALEETPRLSVALVSKVYPMRSHTVSAEGGSAAVVRDYDSLELHARDTVKGSDFLADQDAVEAFVAEAPGEIVQIEHWGCPWSRDPDGRVSVRAFGGMSVKRTVYASDKTGFHMLHALFQTSLKYDQLTRYDEFFVTSLLVEDGACRGVVAWDIRGGRFICLVARTVILCTGGAGRIFPFTTNGAIKTGDGMALAYRAGVPLKDMEFVQYHPTGLPGTGILITEASRGEGGYLLNAKGDRFMSEYAPNKKELAARDVISRAIVDEMQAGRTFDGPYGNYVHLDLRHLGEAAINKKLPFVRELTRNYVGLDPVVDPIPVRPVVHYMMGGVHTDMSGSTPLSGLYAAGEVACVTINGANRLGSNSLTECLVFGARAGAAAARYAAEASQPRTESLLQLAAQEERRVREKFLERKGGKERIVDLREEMHRVMESGAGIYRNETDLKETCRVLRDLREKFDHLASIDKEQVFNTELTAVLELDFMIDVAETVAQSALRRHESRGSHARTDYKERDDSRHPNHFLVTHTPEGPRFDDLPVCITRFQPEKRSY